MAATSRRRQLRGSLSRAPHRRKHVVVAAAAALTIVAIVVIARQRSRDDVDVPPAIRHVSGLLRRAECGPLELIRATSAGHLLPGQSFDGYDSVPPVAGRHRVDAVPSSPAVLARQPDVERLVHNLEHNYVVVWYDDVAAPETGRLAAFASHGPKVLLTPLEYRDELPRQAAVAITGWEQRMLCRQVPEQAALEAVASYLRGPGSRAPEPAGG